MFESDLSETYVNVRPTIVALGSKLIATPMGVEPLFPKILGTGFLVDDRGFVATNTHVVEIMMKLPKHPSTGAPSAIAMLFTPPKIDGENCGAGLLMVEPKSYAIPEAFSCDGLFYGQDLPDIAFIKLKIKNTPFLPLDDAPGRIRSGLSVATAGFPLGTDSLTPYGKVCQIAPFLRRGIVSSVLPFECPLPHGFTTDITIQGGSSGSPVFREGLVSAIGMLHAHAKGAPNISFAIPASLISAGLKCVTSQGVDDADDPIYADLLAHAPARGSLEFETIGSKG